MDKNEIKEWLLKHNFHEALRVAVADLVHTENYEPFAGLAIEGKAVVGIRIDSYNNLHFYTVEQAKTAMEPDTEVMVTDTSPSISTTEITETPKAKPKKVKKT